MSLLDLMSSGNRFEKIHVNDIRRNEQNFYATIAEDEETNVEDMAKLIAEDGQDSNGVVYEDTSIEDGKKYTLIAGERRWKALKLNYERGQGDGLYEVKIIRKPERAEDELLRIIRDNAQRDKGKEVRRQEVLALNSIWETLVSENRKPEGKKRDWIAKNCGLSPRRVQDYLTGSEAEITGNEEDSGNVATSESEEQESQGLSSADKEYLKELAKNMSDSMGRKVKISDKCVISIKCNDLNDLPTVLTDLGFTEDGDWR